MKKRTLLAAAGLLVVAAGSTLVGSPAQAAAENHAVTVLAIMSDTAVLATDDGIASAKKQCVEEDGPDVGVTLKDPVVFRDPAGKVVGQGVLTKVSLRPQAGDFAYFYNCEFSGKLAVGTAKWYSVKVGKRAPVNVTYADLAKDNFFLKLTFTQ